MNKGSSASISSGGQILDASLIASSYQRSRDSCQSTGLPVFLMTITFLSCGQADAAKSTLALMAMVLPPRLPSSAQTT